MVEDLAEEEGLRVIGWRSVPIDDSMIGPTARAVMPSFWHCFVTDPAGSAGIDLDRKLFVLRKRTEHEIRDDLPTYFPSLSSRTLVYKGMLTTPQLGEFFPDLRDPRIESALALVHSRFSTNTFPSWPLAHPYRFSPTTARSTPCRATATGCGAREALMETPLIPGLERAFPIITEGASDTASFDECLELLHLGGRSLAHAVLMMIPEAWENHATMSPGQARVLPLPLVAHGAVGRPGVDRVHRRHRDRRGARPQRPAPEPLLGHRRRPRDHGERVRVWSTSTRPGS